MKQQKFYMFGKTDRNGDEFYLCAPEVPMFIDLSKAVLQVHPWEDDDGRRFGATLIVKTNQYLEAGGRDDSEGQNTSASQRGDDVHEGSSSGSGGEQVEEGKEGRRFSRRHR